MMTQPVITSVVCQPNVYLASDLLTSIQHEDHLPTAKPTEHFVEEGKNDNKAAD
jgi:hypothetical protein